MSCDNQISTQDLINAKTDAVTLGEIATSHKGAAHSGALITQSTNRFGGVTDTVQGRLNKLVVIFDNPIRDWSSSLLVSDLRAHRYPATNGDIYIPLKPLPFTTGATFNVADWTLYQGLSNQDIINDLSQTYNFPTVAAFKASPIEFPITKTVSIKDHKPEGGGETLWDVVLTSNVTTAQESIQSSAIPTKSIVKRDAVSEYDLFVVYGQSNGLGFAGNSVGRQAVPSNTFFWSNRVPPAKWNPIEYGMQYLQPGSANSTGHAWVEFAREYRARTGKGVLIVPAAFGGVDIAQLSKGGGTYYQVLVDAVAEVVADTTYTIDKKILLWCQGESDMSNGTTRDGYQSAFISLWNDLKADSGLEFCYMSRVGMPQDRSEVSRYPIQVAQDYLCDQLLDVAMAFDGASAFTTSNLMLQDGVHYSQKGYNLMGNEMGKFVAQREVNNSALTPVDINQYQGLTTPGDVVHRLVGCTLYNNGTNWELKQLTDGGEYRSAFVTSINVESTRILVNLALRGQDVISINSHVNEKGNEQGITCAVSLGASSSQIVIELRSTISAFVDTVTGAVTYPPNGTGANTGLLSDLSGALDAGIMKLSYAGSGQAPVITPYTTSGLTQFIPVAQKVVGGNEVWFKYETTPTETKAIVSFIAKGVDPSTITLAGLTLNVSAVIGERAL